jgi:hypothetical protein
MSRNISYAGTTLWSNFCSRLQYKIADVDSIRMASEYKLYPVYKEEFHHVFEENHEHPTFGPLLEKMKVVDGNGESSLDEDQWEAASAFRLALRIVILIISQISTSHLLSKCNSSSAMYCIQNCISIGMSRCYRQSAVFGRRIAKTDE